MKLPHNNQLTQLVCVALLILSISAGTKMLAQTSEPSREPILKIETGMHTASIRSSTDAGNSYLVTASDDKTVRVWELPSGHLLRIIRPPIGNELEGRIYAVAISPNGSVIAAGGVTGSEWEGYKSASIYIFDRDSGRMIRRLTGLPTAITGLSFSPDGRFLAATLSVGIRVYHTSTYAVAGEDINHDRVGGPVFSDAGDLITTSVSGVIRLYRLEGSQTLRLIVKRGSNPGTFPVSFRFSVDGARIAALFLDSTTLTKPTVSVLSTRDLSNLYSPVTNGLENARLTGVTWSVDGHRLYVWGLADPVEGGGLIRVWQEEGRGIFNDIRGLPIYGVNQVITLRDGSILFTAKSAFGLLDPTGRQVFFTGLTTADFSNLRESFLLSPDGTSIGFAYEALGRAPAVFSLPDRKLDVSPLKPTGWSPPQTDAATLNVTDWKDNFAPQLNGKPLALRQREFSVTIAISRDRRSFLLGTTFGLHLFDSSGIERWRIDTPSFPLALNISADERFAVAAYSDGTIRWYNRTDGKELLAFFPHADRKRWVLWTPSGYYDASPGAEDLVGWHVNNGKDQAADFFPVGQFRSTYYRPDVISKVLGTGDEAEALRLADEERGRVRTQGALIMVTRPNVVRLLPPVVDIASPADNSEVSASEVSIRYSLRTPSGEPITNVRALVDGRPVAANRQLTREELSTSGQRELKVSVPEHDSEVSIIAENRFAASVPATIRLKWRGGTASTTEAFVIQPKLYVLAIGVSQYQNASYSLKFAAKDAQDFAAATATQKGFLYRDVVVKVLTDDQASKDNILDGLDWIRKETTSKDVAMVFFAGHGLNDQNGVYYFLPYNTDLEKLLRTGVPFTDIKNTVQSLAGKTLFFIDTCHSGNVLGGRRGLADDLNGIINELSSAESGAVVFAASTGNQYSLEDAKWENGAFTKALVEGISGRADYDKSGKGRITINMLDLYLSERVKELTGGRQTPTTAKPNTIQDFPIAVKR